MGDRKTTVSGEIFRINQRIESIEIRFQGIAEQEQSLALERAALEDELKLLQDTGANIGLRAGATLTTHK